MEATVTYLFGRLNLVAHYDDKRTYLISLMESRKYLHKRGFEWGIFDVEALVADGQAFIFGHLCKYLPSDSEEIVDKSAGKTGQRPVDNHLVAKSPFVLHVKSGLIAFHPVPNHIVPSTFRKMFAELLKHAQDKIMIEADVQMVHQEYQILKVLKKFDQIRSLKIELHPSNPSNREVWKRTDERLRRMKARTFKQEYTSMDGLQVDENDEVYGDILMASDGYGKASIHGIMNGKVVTASTEQVPVKGQAPSEAPPQRILDHLIEWFREIWDRMKRP